MQIGVNAMDKFSFTSVSAHTDHIQIKLREINREEESEGMEEFVLAILIMTHLSLPSPRLSSGYPSLQLVHRCRLREKKRTGGVRARKARCEIMVAARKASTYEITAAAGEGSTFQIGSVFSFESGVFCLLNRRDGSTF